MAADPLWAPWRMEFIKDKRQQTGEGPCVFCELKSLEPNSENLVLYRGKQNYIVMNRFPYTCGHLLVIPYDHKADLKELSKETYEEILTLTAKSIDILKKELGAEGFNCGMNVGRVAGAGILDHFHWHIVPRWSGDTNFLPVLGGVRTMPECLSDTHKKLAHHFKN